MTSHDVLPAQCQESAEIECFASTIVKLSDGGEISSLIRLGRIYVLRGLWAQVGAFVMAQAVKRAKRKPPAPLDADEMVEKLLRLGTHRHQAWDTEQQDLLVTHPKGTPFDRHAVPAFTDASRNCLLEFNARAFGGFMQANAVFNGDRTVTHQDHRVLYQALHRRLVEALSWAQREGVAPDNPDELLRLTETLTRTRDLLAVQQVSQDPLFVT